MAMDFEKSSSQWIDLGTNLTVIKNVPGATIMTTVVPESQGGAGVNARVVNIASGTSATSGRAAITQLGAATSDTWQTAGRRLDADGATGANYANAVTTAARHQVASVSAFTGGYQRLIHNGVQQANTAVGGWSANCSNTDSLNAAIGSVPNGTADYFDGIVGAVRVFNRALSNDEVINAQTARGRSRNYYGCVLCYPLNEGAPGTTASGSGTVKDRMGNYNGTPTNSPVYAEAVTYPRPPRRRG